MPPNKPRIDVMVSCTSVDLKQHRERVASVISRLRMVPQTMDMDSTTGKEGLDYSLGLVDDVPVYILLLGFRYGHIPEDSRNPDRLSMTHLEYRRALEREARGELCVLPFVMADDHLLLHDHIETDPDKRKQLKAFRAAVLDKQVAFFSSIDDLEKKVLQALPQSECVQQLSSAEVARPFEPRVGAVLDGGRYVLEERLGQGGNGEVWRVRVPLPDGTASHAAIKLLKPEITARPERVERFKNEISIAWRLHHPNIIRTTHWLQVGTQYCAVMDYLDGQTLRQWMAGRSLPLEQVADALEQIAAALDYAHTKHTIVHRDVKPENILLQEDKLYLGDWGLAFSPEDEATVSVSGELVGNRKYMAPEQWNNQPVSAQTDGYALGIIAWEMLTGSYPYDVTSHASLMLQHLQTELPEHPDLPAPVLRILRRASAKTPTERYPSVTAFITDLRHWQLDPADIETPILKYLDRLKLRIRGEVYEQFFVDLEGDAREIVAAAPPAADDRYADPDMDALIREMGMELDADHHDPQVRTPEYVPKILDRLLSSPRVVLVGEPGAGKTFLLRRLVMALLRERGERVPVFVPLNAFKGVDASDKPQSFEAYVQAQLDEALRPYFDRLLRDGRLVLICDALNEMPRQTADGERKLVEEVRTLLAKAPRFVVSCRIRDYQRDLDALKLERLEVRDMDLPAIRQFIEKHLRAEAPAFWTRIGGGELLDAYWKAVRDAGEPERFWQREKGVPGYTTRWEFYTAWKKMWQGAGLIPLARRPYLAGVICRLHRSQRIPDNRAELYQAFIDDLIQREAESAKRRGQPFPDRAALEGFLDGVALRMQQLGVTVVRRDAIADLPGDVQAALDAALLVQEGDDIRFSHQLLQEYFAARTLKEQMTRDDDPRPLLGAAWWSLATWRETGQMLAEYTHDAPAVARWLGRASPELGLEIMRRATPEGEPLNLDAETRQRLITAALERQDEPNPVGRAAAWRALSALRDPRRGVGLLPDGLPDIDWVPIPAGRFIMGADDRKDTPRREVEIRHSFRMAKYPVTYRQFQAFVDSGEYADKRWWRDFPPECRPQPMAEQVFSFDNHPRDTVSWYQAVAFTRWLTARLQRAGRLAKGLQIRLPTEEEWEYAARGTDERRFPYPGEFDAGKGNTGLTGIRQTSAVGIFPDGASPFGVLDMSGNVWEWCLNDYDAPKVVDGYGNGKAKVLRGGSWYNSDTDYFRCDARDGYLPVTGNGSGGFRLALSS